MQKPKQRIIKGVSTCRFQGVLLQGVDACLIGNEKCPVFRKCIPRGMLKKKKTGMANNSDVMCFLPSNYALLTQIKVEKKKRARSNDPSLVQMQALCIFSR